MNTEQIDYAIQRDRSHWFDVLDEEPEAETAWLAKEMEEYYAVELCPREPDIEASGSRWKWYERKTDELAAAIEVYDWYTAASEMMDDYAARRQRDYVAHSA